MSTVRRTRGAALLAALTAVAVLTGCTSDEEPDGPEGSRAPVVQLGAPGEDNTTLSPEEAEAIEGPGFTDADVAFVQGMIPHHGQALEMTALVPARSAQKGIKLLARRIEISQEAEIAQIRRWLLARGEAVPKQHQAGGGHGALMPGMLTDAELERLEAAKGAEFDRLFLTFMIRHHEGALKMVADLRSSDGGGESEIDAFARHVDADQQIEIGRMRETLQQLPR